MEHIKSDGNHAAMVNLNIENDTLLPSQHSVTFRVTLTR